MIKNAFLIVVIIGLSLGVLYWTDLEKYLGMIIVNLILFCFWIKKIFWVKLL